MLRAQRLCSMGEAPLSMMRQAKAAPCRPMTFHPLQGSEPFRVPAAESLPERVGLVDAVTRGSPLRVEPDQVCPQRIPVDPLRSAPEAHHRQQLFFAISHPPPTLRDPWLVDDSALLPPAHRF